MGEKRPKRSPKKLVEKCEKWFKKMTEKLIKRRSKSMA